MKGFLNCVLSVEELWKANHNREEMYRQAMALENFISLRKICATGHISSVLFQKELQNIYDQVKCPLAQKELTNDNKHQCNEISVDENNPLCVIWALKECERNTIELYQRFLSSRELDEPTQNLLYDHLEKLKELDKKLTSELKIKSKKHAVHIYIHESIVERHRFIHD